MFKRANLHWLTTSTYVDLVAFSHVINVMGSSKMLLPWPVFPSILGITAKKWLTIPTRSTQEKYNRKSWKGKSYTSLWLTPWPEEAVLAHPGDTETLLPVSQVHCCLWVSASLWNSLSAWSLDSSIGVCFPSSWHTGHWIPELGENFSPQNSFLLPVCTANTRCLHHPPLSAKAAAFCE